MTSYQKRKQEIENLRNDIHTLVMNQDTPEYFMVNTSWRLKFKEDEQVLFGEGTTDEVNGIVS